MAFFSDNFNRANAVLSSPYAIIPLSSSPLAQIVSNRIRANNSGTPQGCWNYLTTPSVGANQVTRVTGFMNSATDSYAGPICRASTAAHTCYFGPGGGISGDAYAISKVVAGSFTTISQSARLMVSNDVIELTCNGSTQTLTVNGTAVVTGSDTAISSGQPGFVMGWNPGGADGDLELDDFTCGDYPLPTGIAVPQYASYPKFFMQPLQTITEGRLR